MSLQPEPDASELFAKHLRVVAVQPGRPVAPQPLHQRNAFHTGIGFTQEHAYVPKFRSHADEKFRAGEPPWGDDDVEWASAPPEQRVDAARWSLPVTGPTEPGRRTRDDRDRQLGVTFGDEIQDVDVSALTEHRNTAGDQKLDDRGGDDERKPCRGVGDERADAHGEHPRDDHRLVAGNVDALEVADERVVRTEQLRWPRACRRRRV